MASTTTALTHVEEQRNELLRMQTEYNSLVTVLHDFQQNNSLELLVPICGSNQVLCHGQITNTNTVLCQLNDTTYVRRTIQNCIDKTLKPRAKMVESVIEEHNTQIDKLKATISLMKQGAGGDELKPGVHRTSEGYFEIVEKEEEADARESRPTSKSPLIQVVDKKEEKKEEKKEDSVGARKDTTLGEVVEKEVDDDNFTLFQPRRT